MVKEKNIFINNPVAHCNYYTDSLDRTKEVLLLSLKQLVDEQNISEEEILAVIELIDKVYNKKRASYLLETKVGTFFKYLSESCNFALKSNKKIDESDYTEFTYLNHTKKLLTNEQYG